MSFSFFPKISPLLQQAFHLSMPVPFIAQVNFSNIYDLFSLFDTFKIDVYQKVPTFGMMSGIAPPVVLKKFEQQKFVRYIYPDISQSLLTSFNPIYALIDNPINNSIYRNITAINDNLIFPFVKGFFINPLTNFDMLSFPDKFMKSVLTPGHDLIDKLGKAIHSPINLPRIESNVIFGMGQAVSKIKTSEDIEKTYPTSYIRELMGLDKAKEVGITGKGIRIAILDTGISPINKQISKGTISENAMVTDIPPDSNGHGTHVSTIAFGDTIVNYKNVHLEGMAPESKGISIKVLGHVIGSGRNSDVIKGMEIAMKHKADIISMSLGSGIDQNLPSDPSFDDPLCGVIRKLTEKGIIVTVASGNSGANSVGLPGGEESAITVGAIDPKDNVITPFSSTGPFYGRVKPDVSSYGNSIYSSTAIGSLLDILTDGIPDGFAPLSGTSQATPVIAGLLACAKQIFPTLNSSHAKRIFAANGSNKDSVYGWGIPVWGWFEDLIKR